MTPDEMRNAPMGYYEVAARLKDPEGTEGLFCNTLESLMADEKRGIFSDITKVGFHRLREPDRDGPGKGGRRPIPGTDRFVFVTRDEMKGAVKAYETASGLCGHCTGGVQQCGFDKNGFINRPCTRCGGTGTPKIRDQVLTSPEGSDRMRA